MPLELLILLVGSWISRRQGEAIEYLRAENRVLRARLGDKRLRFDDAERRLLAQKGKPLGRKLLVVVVAPTEYGDGLDRAVQPRHTRDRLLLGERLVRARLVVEAREFANQMVQVPLAKDQDVIE